VTAYLLSCLLTLNHFRRCTALPHPTHSFSPLPLHMRTCRRWMFWHVSRLQWVDIAFWCRSGIFHLPCMQVRAGGGRYFIPILFGHLPPPLCATASRRWIYHVWVPFLPPPPPSHTRATWRWIYDVSTMFLPPPPTSHASASWRWILLHSVHYPIIPTYCSYFLRLQHHPTHKYGTALLYITYHPSPSCVIFRGSLSASSLIKKFVMFLISECLKFNLFHT